MKATVQSSFMGHGVWRKILFLLVFWGISLAGNAQQAGLDTLRIVDEPKQLENELVANRRANKDDNGRLAASLWIESDLSGFSFDANNGIIRSTSKPGLTKLYLQPDEMRVIVYKQGYENFEIYLPDYGIDFESGDVWNIKITGDKEVDKIPVNFQTTPEDAKIRVNGKLVESSPVQLVPGKHSVQIQREQYNSVTDTINVSANKNYFEYELTEVEMQKLTIRSTPSNARVYLDNSNVGTTPLERFRFPGQYQLTVSKDGYMNVNEQITVGVGNNEFDYELLRNISYLQVSVEPDSATVLLNNNQISEDQHIEKVPGQYKLEVRAQGYKTYSEYLELERDSTITRDISLDREKGDLQISSVTPATAKITLEKDGSVIDSWQGIKNITDLGTGTYTVIANATGYFSQKRKVTVKPDTRNSVDLRLDPIKEVSTVSVQGIPGSASISFTGLETRNKNIERSFDSFPVQKQTMQYGLYEMQVKKEGFKTIEKRVRIDQRQVQLALTRDFNAKSKFGSVMWSLFVPGGGPFYMGRTGRGFLYLLAEGGAIGYAVKSGLDYMGKRDQYQAAKRDYEDATNGFKELRQRVNSTYDAQKAAQKKMMLGLGVFAGVKFIELLDNLFYPSPQKKLKEAKLDLENNGSSVVLRYNF